MSFRSQKENLKQLEAQEEQRLLRGQKEYLDLEVRKFRRKKILSYHSLEQELLHEELLKRQQQLEQAHSMLLRHHEKTQELEYRQQKAVSCNLSPGFYNIRSSDKSQASRAIPVQALKNSDWSA